MAIWYWDPVNGNDANDGTTFANRKKTLQSLTAVAAGDSVRCIKSPDAVSTGIDATWTDGSNTVTLSSAQTQLIASCDTNWTASANVSCATNTNRKEGTNSQLTSIGTAFTTGKAAYFATGTLNCAGYQQITFWMKQTSGTLAVSGDYTMSLCSDTAGATQVNNFAIPAIPVLNKWFPVTVDLATNLGASIQSVAFYVNVDKGAAAFQFDNINVALASSSAGAITCNSLISKNTGTEAWFGIRSISGTTVIIDSSPQYTLDLTAIEPTYSGTTETVALYRRETLKPTPVSIGIVNYYAGAVGTSDNLVTISGGWDTTDMSTQTGQSYIDGTNGQGTGFSLSNSSTNRSYISVSGLNFCRYDLAVDLSQQSTATVGYTFTSENLNNNETSAVKIAASKGATITINNIVKNGSLTTAFATYLSASTNRFSLSIVNLNSNWGSALSNASSTYQYASTISITNLNRNQQAGILLYGAVSNTINVTTAQYNAAAIRYGNIQLEANTFYTLGNVPSNGSVNSHDNTINIGNMTGTGTNNIGIVFGPGCNNNKIIMTGVFTGYTSTTIPAIAAFSTGANYFTSNTASFAGQGLAQVSTGKLYISSADTTLPSIQTGTGLDGQVVIKNVYGIPNQNYITPQYWGLT